MSTTVDEEIEVLWDFAEDQEMFYVEEVNQLKSRPVFDIVKRLFDLICSLAALIVLLVPMIIIAIIIMIDSKDNPIYVQTRLGKNQKPFKIIKFRTMVADAEKDGIQWANEDDSRVTNFGRILRNSRLDELPQLINIIKGEMSIVGPRPERPEFYDVFDKYIVGFRQRMLVKPGLTGCAQVNGGYFLRPEEKIVYDIEYIKKRSVWIDLVCILKTVGIVFTNEGAK